MGRYFQYLKYLLRHKWYVFTECWWWGIPIRGLLHDLSKFRPSELIPYARYFYASDGTPRKWEEKTGYIKPVDSGDKAYDYAWLLHLKRNPHHWQYWVLLNDSDGVKVLQMPFDVMEEMICDWIGAGKAQGFFSPAGDRFLEVRNWYQKNKDAMQFHPVTQKWIEDLIGITWEEFKKTV